MVWLSLLRTAGAAVGLTVKVSLPPLVEVQLGIIGNLLDGRWPGATRELDRPPSPPPRSPPPPPSPPPLLGTDDSLPFLAVVSRTTYGSSVVTDVSLRRDDSKLNPEHDYFAVQIGDGIAGDGLRVDAVPKFSSEVAVPRSLAQSWAASEKTASANASSFASLRRLDSDSCWDVNAALDASLVYSDEDFFRPPADSPLAFFVLREAPLENYAACHRLSAGSADVHLFRMATSGEEFVARFFVEITSWDPEASALPAAGTYGFEVSSADVGSGETVSRRPFEFVLED